MVAIKDMKMPSCCLWDCPLAREDGGACQLDDVRTSKKERPKDCPLVEIGTCKDCSRYNRNEMFCTWHGGYLMYTCDPDFYCKDFEKRGDSDDNN